MRRRWAGLGRRLGQARANLFVPGLVVAFVVAVGASYYASAPEASASSYQSTSGSYPTVSLPSSKSALAEGRQLFLENCSSCHGVNAEGSALAPNLVGLGAATYDFWIGTGRMPLAYPSAQAPEHPVKFTATQRLDMDAWLASLGKGPGIPKVTLKGADLAKGEELFSLNCAGCHTIEGVGDALADGYYAPSLYPATATQVEEAMRTGPGNMPRFGPKQISVQQANDIAAYVTEVIQHPNDRGGFGLGHVGPVAEGAVAIFGGVGVMLLLAYWIGDRAKYPKTSHGTGHASSAASAGGHGSTPGGSA